MNYTRVLVVAGTVEEFHEFLRQSKSISTLYTFVDGVYKFQGITKEHLKGVFIGTWYNRPDIQDIANAISIIKGGLPMKVVDKLHEMELKKVQTSKPGYTFTPLPISNGGTISATEYRVDQGLLPGQNKTNRQVYDEVFQKLNALAAAKDEDKGYIYDSINNLYDSINNQEK